MSAVERALMLLEHLASVEQDSIADICRVLPLQPSSAHRILGELIRLGYVRQRGSQGHYSLTIKLSSLGLTHLAARGITDIAQPILDELAHEVCELVRFSVVEGDDLIWIAKSQGAKAGLRYDPDPDMGLKVNLGATASGLARLLTLTDNEAVMLLGRQGVEFPLKGFGSAAPTSIDEFLQVLGRCRSVGYGFVHDSYEDGTSAMAMPVVKARSAEVIGVISIAGPSVRMTAARMSAMALPLRAATEQLAEIGAGLSFANSAGFETLDA